MELILSILLKAVSIVMLVVFILSVVVLVLTFRKPREVSVVSISITIAISLVMLIVFSSMTGYDPPAWLWLLMVACGGAAGWFWARTTQVYVQGNRVMSRNSVLYLIIWGGIFALNQLIIIATNRPPDIAMALLIASTATIWGTNASILSRYIQASKGISTAGSGGAG